MAVSVTVLAETVSAAGCCATLTVTLAEALPAVARTVVVPLPAAAMTPLPETVATFDCSTDQLTAAFMGAPFWSRTDAVTCTVCPRCVKFALVLERLTAEGTGVGGGALGLSEQETIYSRTSDAIRIVEGSHGRYFIQPRAVAMCGTKSGKLRAKSGRIMRCAARPHMVQTALWRGRCPPPLAMDLDFRRVTNEHRARNLAQCLRHVLALSQAQLLEHPLAMAARGIGSDL